MKLAASLLLTFITPAAHASASFTAHCTVQALNSTQKYSDKDIVLSESNSRQVLYTAGSLVYLIDYGTFDIASGGTGYTLALTIGDQAQNKNLAYSKSTWESASDKTSVWIESDLAGATAYCTKK